MFPEDILSHVRNMPLYIELLDTLKTVLSLFTYIFKKIFVVDIFTNLDKILGAQIRILRNIPSLGSSLRKDILNILKFELSEIHNFEKNDQQFKLVPKELYERKNGVFVQLIDRFLDLDTMQGKTKMSKEVMFYSRNVIVTFISHYRELMTVDQLRKSLQILIKKLLELSGSWNLKNTLIYIIFRLNDDITKRMQQRPVELQMEIMETLIHMHKDLEKQL